MILIDEVMDIPFRAFNLNDVTNIVELDTTPALVKEALKYKCDVVLNLPKGYDNRIVHVLLEQHHNSFTDESWFTLTISPIVQEIEIKLEYPNLDIDKYFSSAKS